MADDFADLARYYDPIMDHVDYDRWFLTTCALAEFLPDEFSHLDAACGTGVLLHMLRHSGWDSVGIDLSESMLRIGRKQRGGLPLAQADLRALPFHHNVDFITCLFDSMNFLLVEADVEAALRSLGEALSDDGLLYFDVVTERMITEHFADKDWDEDNPGFSSHWESRYDRKRSISETRVRVNTGAESVIRERVYPLHYLEHAVRQAGLSILAVYDAETWNPPSKRTTRAEFLVKHMVTPDDEAKLRDIRTQVRRLL